MQETDKASRRKKSYQKPTVRMIPLRPDEAVLGNCKTASTANTKNIGSSFTCAIPTSCTTIGS